MAAIVTFGEAMIRLVPPAFQRLEQTDSLSMTVGGSELNVAADLARLGLDSAWVSVLPEHPLGRYIRNKGREQGVDTRHVVFTKNGRTGLYFVEYGSSPRASKVYYDRENSAISQIAVELEWETILADSQWFHASGITPALSQACAAEVQRAIEAAKNHGLTVSYDLNYRGKLWTSEEAQKVTQRYVEKIDVCVGNEEDFQKVLGVSLKEEKDDFERIDVEYYKKLAEKVQQQYGFQAVGISLRESTSVLRNNWTGLLFTGGQGYVSKEYELELVDRVGGGDAFSAGLLYSLWTQKTPQEAVEFAAAFSALKQTIWGDMNLVTLDEVENLLQSGGARIQR